MNENLSSAQFTTVGRKQISDDDIISRGDKGPVRVRRVEHSENGFTYVHGVDPDTGERAMILLSGRQKARRHTE